MKSMTLRVALLIASACGAASQAYAAEQACDVAPFDRAALRALAANQFRDLDASQRRALALALLPCLESPDAELRDALAFRAYARLMRRDELDADTLRRLERELRARLFPNDGRDAGFRHAFAVLVLADVAGADARTPFLDTAGRRRLLQAATRYLHELRDWRGFDPVQGWRHGVAHASDLVEQLALHPAISRDDLAELLDALALQIAPPAEHFYIFGEPERLAAAATAIARRDQLTADAWKTWLVRVAETDWSAAFDSLSGLARRHNTMAFLSAFELQLRAQDDAGLVELADAIARQRRAIP